MSVYIVGNYRRLFTKKHTEIRYIKVGVSNEPQKRLKQLQTGCPFPLELIKVFECEDDYKVEKFIHQDLKTYRCQGEWFEIPNTRLSEIINWIIKIANKGSNRKAKPWVSKEEKYRSKVLRELAKGTLDETNIHRFTKQAFKRLDRATKNKIAFEELFKEMPYLDYYNNSFK